MDRIRKKYNLKGRVQGVGFRYFTKQTAQTFNINGWVRNERDGTVTIEAEGEPAQMNQFEEKIRYGPGSAHVEYIEEREVSGEKLENKFAVRYI